MLVGLGFTQADANQLIAMGLISPVLDLGKTNVVSESKPTEQLGGFRLNLAVVAAGSYYQLVELFPKIKDAAGSEKSLALENALRGRV